MEDTNFVTLLVLNMHCFFLFINAWLSLVQIKQLVFHTSKCFNREPTRLSIVLKASENSFLDKASVSGTTLFDLSASNWGSVIALTQVGRVDWHILHEHDPATESVIVFITCSCEKGNIVCIACVLGLDVVTIFLDGSGTSRHIFVNKSIKLLEKTSGINDIRRSSLSYLCSSLLG